MLATAACQGGSPHLSSTEEMLVLVNPATHDFGSLQVGQTSPAFTVNILPSGVSSDDIVSSITESCPDFSVNAPGLPAEVYRTCEPCCPAGAQICPQGPVACCVGDTQSYSFDTFFTPTVAGASSCVVTISLNNGATTKTVTLNGTGTPRPVTIVVNPTSVNFGDVRRATDSTAVGISVSNTGGSMMNVSSVTVSPGFTMTGSPGGYQILSGGSKPYTVTCHPTAVGPLSGMFTVDSDATNTPHLTVPLMCNGIDSNLTITPSPVTLPTTRVGEPVETTVHLVNSGNAPMQLESVTVTGTDLAMTSGGGAMQLGSGASTDVTVSFSAPTKEMATGDLVVMYDGQQRSTHLSAQALGTSMSLNPDGDIDFGPVCSGQMKDQAFAIKGNDDGSFKVNAISTPDAPFMLTAPALPADVQGSGLNTVGFSVTAAPSAAGHQVSTMMVTTDIPGGTPHMINLSVDGLTAGVSPTPDMVDFDANPIDTTTIGQNVSLSNCSTGPITAMNARIEGADASEFAIVQQPDSLMIAPTGSVGWLVVMQAHTAGTKQASFVVDYDGGTAMVPLTGEGLGDNGSGDGTGAGGGEKSYYTCAAGGTGAGWPIAGVLLLVLRRRKRR